MQAPQKGSAAAVWQTQSATPSPLQSCWLLHEPSQTQSPQRPVASQKVSEQHSPALLASPPSATHGPQVGCSSTPMPRQTQPSRPRVVQSCWVSQSILHCTGGHSAQTSAALQQSPAASQLWHVSVCPSQTWQVPQSATHSPL